MFFTLLLDEIGCISIHFWMILTCCPIEIPGREKEIPSEEMEIPGEGKVIPSEWKEIPSEGIEIPSEEKEIPGEAIEIPSEGNIIPGEEKCNTLNIILDKRLFSQQANLILVFCFIKYPYLSRMKKRNRIGNLLKLIRIR